MRRGVQWSSTVIVAVVAMLVVSAPRERLHAQDVAYAANLSDLDNLTKTSIPVTLTK